MCPFEKIGTSGRRGVSPLEVQSTIDAPGSCGTDSGRRVPSGSGVLVIARCVPVTDVTLPLPRITPRIDHSLINSSWLTVAQSYLVGHTSSSSRRSIPRRSWDRRLSLWVASLPKNAPHLMIIFFGS